jgi:hypothetical protein
MNLITRTPRIQLALKQGELLSLEKSPIQSAIECEHGILWVTASGDNNDHMLYAGSAYLPYKNSKVVIEALEDSNFEIEETPTYLGITPPILFRALRGQAAR